MKTTKNLSLNFVFLAFILPMVIVACGEDDDDDDVTTTAATDTSSQIAFTNTALSQDGFACGALTVAVQDSSGTAVAQPADIIIGLSSSDSTGAFYSDSSCSTAINEVTIPTDSSSSTLYYKQTSLSASTLTAAESPDASLTDGTQAVTMSALLVGTFTGSCSQNSTTNNYETVSYTIGSDNSMSETTTVYGTADTTCASSAEHSVVVTGTVSIGDVDSSLELTRKFDFTRTKVEITPLTAAVVSTFNTGSYCGKSDWVLSTAFDNIGNACSNLSLSAITASSILYQLGQVKSSALILGNPTTDLDASTDAKRPTALATTSYTKQ